MSTLIIGEQALSLIPEIASSLKYSTLSYAKKVDATDYPHYVPWFAARPKLARNQSDSIIYDSMPILDGRVVVESRYLSAVQEFIFRDKNLVANTLIGTEEDWLVSCSVKEDRPLMIRGLNEACDNISGKSVFFEMLVRNTVEMIIPLLQKRARGLSSDLFRGAVFLGFPENYSSMNLELDVVHELAHQSLALFQSVDPLFDSDPLRPVYSYVRNNSRPAIQSLHAAAAIAFMAKYCQDCSQSDYIHPDFSERPSIVLIKALIELRRECKFTRVGNDILNNFFEIAEA